MCGVTLVSLTGDQPSSASTTPAVEYTSPPDLRGAIYLSNTQVHVRNDDAFAWTNCSVSINPGIVRSGWSQDVARIAPGEIITGGLMAFTRSGGERFQPSQYVVETVGLSCETPAGRAYYSGRITPGEPPAPVRSRPSGRAAPAPRPVGVPRADGRFVGDPLIRTYSPIELGCARSMIQQGVFFATEAQAIEAGYRLHAICR